MKNCQKVRSRIIDNQSKIIYDGRLSFSLTGEQDHIFKMLEEIDGLGNVSNLKERLARENYKKLVIFGAGYNGLFIRESLSEYKWAAYLDNKVETVTCEDIVASQTSTLENHKHIEQLPIYNPQYYLDKYGANSTFFVISVPGFSAQRSIIAQLKMLGVHEPDIFALTPSNALIPQYFETFAPSKLETFVDCGVLDGDTSFDFARWCRGHYRKIFAFEPDKDNYNACRTNLSKLADISLYNLGVWDCEEVLRFNCTSTGFSSIHKSDEVLEKDNVVEIKTCSLDDCLKGEEVTFIKMDIEGAELKALQGAEKIISQQKPKLAICVYHKPEDILEIPELLLDLNPEYKFRLRHYGVSAYETVLYAE